MLFILNTVLLEIMVQVQQARFWFRGQNCFYAAHYW